MTPEVFIGSVIVPAIVLPLAFWVVWKFYELLQG